jgi:hypothetical protein
MNIYNFDRWNDLNEERITPISLDKFKELMNKYAHSNQNVFLYKKIINPKSKIGIFYTTTKQFENHIKELKSGEKQEWYGFPQRELSLVCYNYVEKEEGETFIVFPFKSSLFTISSKKEWDNEVTSENCNKGYWTDKIKWMENLDHREFWTESPCLIISEKTWLSINKKV